MPKPQYTQKFRTVWLKDPVLKNWLTFTENAYGKIAKCKFCKNTLSNKICDLKLHAKSKKHISLENIIDGTRNKTQATLQFHKLEIDSAKIAECKLALCIAEHGSIRHIDHLTPLCQNIFQCTTSENIQLKRTKCSAIIRNVLGPYFIEQLKEDIGESPYSLLLDESTDIAVQKYLGITIIYYCSAQKKIISTYVELCSLEAGDAEAIVYALLTTIKKFTLKLQNLKGIGVDNASVNTGINTGVYVRLKALVPNLILIRCVCHSLQLAVSAAAKNFIPRNLEFLIQETYDWFSKSSKRQISYTKLYNAINEGRDPLKITQMYNTRWLSIESAVNKIHGQGLELKTHFEIARLSEKCYNAEMLYQMYKDDVNYAYICFLKPILSDIQRVNKSFEGKNVDPTKLLKDLKLLIESLTQKIIVPGNRLDFLKHNIREYVDKKCYLGSGFENKLNEMKEKGFTEEIVLRERCIEFILNVIKEMQHRLPENINILEKINLLSVENTLKTIKPRLFELLAYLNYSAENIEKIENQWSQINLIVWKFTNNTIDFWIEVLNYKDANSENPFKLLADLAISMLVLPHSNAEIERLFSQMNNIKTKIRNKIKLPMLNAVISIREGLKRLNTSCDKFDIPTKILNRIKTNSVYESINAEEIDIDDVLN